MKKKIVAIFVLMLVIATAVPVVTSLKNSVDVPVREKGDSWTYDYHRTEYRYNGSTVWLTQFVNCTLTETVVDDTGDNYSEKTTSKDFKGSMTIGSYRLKYTPLVKLIDEAVLRKTDLAIVQDSWSEKGFVFWLLGNIGIPFPAQFHLSGTLTYTPGNVWLPFPLTAGESGIIPLYSYTVQEKCVLYWGLITLFDHPEQTGTAGLLPYKCEMETITVPAGTFTAYNVSIDWPIGLFGHYSFWQYYVPEMGNNVKIYVNQTTSKGDPEYLIESELVDFNYTP